MDAIIAEIMQSEIRAYKRLHPELWQRYSGQHVAIHDGQMVDHDVDGIALSRRIYQRYPDVFVLVRRVEPAPERVIRLRSPRLVNDQPQHSTKPLRVFSVCILDCFV